MDRENGPRVPVQRAPTTGEDAPVNTDAPMATDEGAYMGPGQEAGAATRHATGTGRAARAETGHGADAGPHTGSGAPEDTSTAATDPGEDGAATARTSTRVNRGTDTATARTSTSKDTETDTATADPRTDTPPVRADADAGPGAAPGLLRFAVLGPVRAWRDGEPVPTGSPQQRALLAALLLRGGRTATASELIDALWGEEPPSQALAAVRTYASRLRKALGPKVLVSESGGYALRTSANALDVTGAQELGAEAEKLRAAGNRAAARDRLAEALDLWDGEVLASVPGPYAENQRTRLEEWRLTLLETRLDIDLEVGAHAEAVSELTALTAAHPLRERLRELLMLALYRSGRQAEALAVYADTRRPRRRARRRPHTRTRPAPAADPPGRRRTRPPGRGGRPGRRARRPPRAAPRDRPGLHGPRLLRTGARLPAVHRRGPCHGRVGARGHRRRRQDDPRRACRARGQAALPGRPAVRGPPWRRPRAAAPETVLGSFLRALGTPDSAIPDSLDERAALYRSTLDGRRVWSSWTTPVTPPRSARCCPARRAARPSSPAGSAWWTWRARTWWTST